MDKVPDTAFPIKRLISFNKLLEQYDRMAMDGDGHTAAKAKRILALQAPYPELREGFTDTALLKKREEVIKVLLQDSFPQVLTHNEIKTASLPYLDVFFNSTERFSSIVANAGEDFELKLKGVSDEFSYIMGCTVVLKFHYGFDFDLRRPMFFDIPDAEGVMRNYRVLYNADFMEILPTEKAKKLAQSDINELLDNLEDLEVWKEKIPPDSFIAKGFVILNIFDATAEQSISGIKSSLIGNEHHGDADFVENFRKIFASFFGVPDIQVGFMAHNAKTQRFEQVYGKNTQSFVLARQEAKACNRTLCQASHTRILGDMRYFAVNDVDRYHELSDGQGPYADLKAQGIKSAILAPIADEGELLGVLELVSKGTNRLNGINAQKLEDIIPFLVSAVRRSKAEEENRIDALIQHECTTVHSSVYWKFQEEARRFILEDLSGNVPSFNEIVFDEVYPLYGQIDIKDSSKERNLAIQRDLMIQLSTIAEIVEEAFASLGLPVYEELLFRLNRHLDDIRDILNTNSEQAIMDFVADEVGPVLEHLKKTDPRLKKMIVAYEGDIDQGTRSYYDHRKNYDQSVMLVNKKLAGVIDKGQEAAQAMFPHYFERYKTDGVEHNMYIGGSIAENMPYDSLYLHNLRLWQLQSMCEMERAHYALKPELPVPLDVASLLLVYSTPLSIRFRMDEKRFDVDGTYNARYEIIKKRIDKSHIKGTNERLTQTGKLAIVYSQKKDELEYLRYIAFLKAKGYFGQGIEVVELEGLQGVSGLKAIRVEILYKTDPKSKQSYTYEDLMQELNG